VDVGLLCHHYSACGLFLGLVALSSSFFGRQKATGMGRAYAFLACPLVVCHLGNCRFSLFPMSLFLSFLCIIFSCLLCLQTLFGMLYLTKQFTPFFIFDSFYEVPLSQNTEFA